MPPTPLVHPQGRIPLSREGRRWAVQIGRCQSLTRVCTLLKDGVRRGVLTVAEAPALAEAAGQRAADAQGAADRAAGGHVYPHVARACRLDITTQVLTTMAVLRGVPVDTWVAWMRATPNEDLSFIVSAWMRTWVGLGRAQWTPARIAQAADLLSAVAPRIPGALQHGLAREWRGGVGPLAERLEQILPAAVFAAIRAGAEYDITVRPVAEVATESGALVDRDEMQRLTDQVDWRRRSPAERAGVLGRCRFDRGTPHLARLKPALKDLILHVVLPTDAGQIPAIRAVVRAQRTVAARAEVIAWLRGIGQVSEAMGRDPVLLAAIADEMQHTPDAARTPECVALILEGWQVLDPARWGRAVAQMLRQQKGRRVQETERTELRTAIESWWVAHEDPAQQIVPELVTECLASADRRLAEWALLHLVPHVEATPTTPTPPTLPVGRAARARTR